MGPSKSKEEHKPSLVNQVSLDYLKMIDKKKKDYIKQHQNVKVRSWKELISTFLRELENHPRSDSLKKELKRHLDENMEIKLSTLYSYISYYDYATSFAQNPFRFSVDMQKKMKTFEKDKSLEGIPITTLDDLEYCKFIIEQICDKDHIIEILCALLRKHLIHWYKPLVAEDSNVNIIDQKIYQEIYELIVFFRDFIVKLLLHFFSPIIEKNIIEEFREAYTECIANNRIFSADDKFSKSFSEIINSVREKHFTQRESLFARHLNKVGELSLSSDFFQVKGKFQMEGEQNPYEKALKKLQSMRDTLNPNRKFEIVSEVYLEVRQCIHDYYTEKGMDEEAREELVKTFDADNFAPILIYIVANSRYHELIRDIDWIDRFVNEKVREDSGFYSINYAHIRETCFFLRDSEKIREKCQTDCQADKPTLSQQVEHMLQEKEV